MLRQATADDAAAIAQLHIASWRSAYRAILDPDYLAGPIEQERRDVWAGRFAAPNADMQVTIAEDGAGPIGFVCTFGNDDPIWGGWSTISTSCHAPRAGASGDRCWARPALGRQGGFLTRVSISGCLRQTSRRGASMTAWAVSSSNG